MYREATQSSTYDDFRAELATNGNEMTRVNPFIIHSDENLRFYYYSCSQTQGEKRPWLVVDLGQTETIQKVSKT